MQATMTSVAEGSTVPHLNVGAVRSLRVVLPGLAEQGAITDVLTVLNQKIESGRRLAEALTNVVVCLGGDAVRQACDKMPLSALVNQIREPGDSTLPYLGLDDMPRGSTVLENWKTKNAPTGSTWAFCHMDILFGKLRPYFKKAGIAPIEGRCTREILVLRPVEPRFFGLLATVIPSQGFVDHCVAHSTGTRMPRAEWKAVSSYEVGLPADDVVDRLDVMARTSYRQVSRLVAEARSLAAIRDALLPKLVSGQIRVPLSGDTEEQIGAAVEALG